MTFKIKNTDGSVTVMSSATREELVKATANRLFDSYEEGALVVARKSIVAATSSYRADFMADVARYIEKSLAA